MATVASACTRGFKAAAYGYPVRLHVAVQLLALRMPVECYSSVHASALQLLQLVFVLAKFVWIRFTQRRRYLALCSAIVRRYNPNAPIPMATADLARAAGKCMLLCFMS